MDPSVILYSPFKVVFIAEFIVTLVFSPNKILCLKIYKELQENKIVVCLLVGKGITWIISSPNKLHSAKFKDVSLHPFHDLCVTNNVKY